jgi:hypothetical protein
MSDTFRVGQELPLVATAIVLGDESASLEGLSVRGTLRYPDRTERDLGISLFRRVEREGGDVFQAVFGFFTPDAPGEYEFRTASDTGTRSKPFTVVE